MGVQCWYSYCTYGNYSYSINKNLCNVLIFINVDVQRFCVDSAVIHAHDMYSDDINEQCVYNAGIFKRCASSTDIPKICVHSASMHKHRVYFAGINKHCVYSAGFINIVSTVMKFINIVCTVTVLINNVSTVLILINIGYIVIDL
jgi:hypothetical protein